MGFMGYLSCIAGRGTSDVRAAVVVDWEGSLLHLEVPATVAELMLEAPGHLVASAVEVQKTRRVLAIQADEPLRPGGVYLLFPAGRAGSRMPDQRLAALDGACGARKRRGGRKGRRAAAGKRVFPGVVACEEEKEEEGEGKRKGGEAKPLFPSKGDDGGFPGCCSVGGARPWRPVLETIHESI